MSQFEYITVLLSIVVAFALSEILSCWGQLIRHRHRVRAYWLHVIWTALALLVLVQVWWAGWEYRELEFDDLPSILAHLAPFLTAVLAVLVLTPDIRDTDTSDMRAYYWDSRTWFFPIAALVMLQLAALDVFWAGHPVMHPEHVPRVAAIGLLIYLAISRSERVHAVVAVGMFVLLAVFVGTMVRGL